jgi:hypothetical protein
MWKEVHVDVDVDVGCWMLDEGREKGYILYIS